MLNSTLILFKYRFFTFRNFLEGLQAKKMLLLKLFHNQDDLYFINGLVMGEKNTEASYLSAFTNAGMLHVLVASGFNVSLVAGLAWFISQKLSKLIRAMVVLGSIWGYTAYLEFEPPLLRAAWMFSLAFLLKHRGIKTRRSRILLIAITSILLIQPALTNMLAWSLASLTKEVSSCLPWALIPSSLAISIALLMPSSLSTGEVSGLISCSAVLAVSSTMIVVSLAHFIL